MMMTESSRTVTVATAHQTTLFDLESKLSNRSHTAVGALGERTAWLLFEKAGYHVSRPAGKYHGDLRVIDPLTGTVAYVEVKTARRSKDKKWRFTLIVQGKTDHRDADYVLLLPVLASGQAVPFIIPADVLANQRQAVITSDPLRYSGKLAAYRRSSLHNFMTAGNGPAMQNQMSGLPKRCTPADRMATHVAAEGFDTMSQQESNEQKRKPVFSITLPIPGWIRMRKIEDHDKVIDIKPANEQHQAVRKNLLRSGLWEEIPCPEES